MESVYENALALELAARGIGLERQRAVPILYRGSEVGLHRLDLLVAGLIVLELKAVKALEDVHFAVVRSYLRTIGREHGLILDFAKPTLEIKRVIASQRPHHDFLASLEAPFSVKHPLGSSVERLAVQLQARHRAGTSILHDVPA
ncbi:MAG TPA: GxxExxY protein, partial [Polyangia bacterium]